MAAAVTVTLDAMAAGGMYDHIGGGFARYSVDREWLVPHFEKMLYDQALLVRGLPPRRVALGTDRWRQVVGETSSTCCATCATRAAASPPPRMPTRPTTTATATRACSTRGRPTRCATCSAPTRTLAIEWFGITDGGNFEGRSIPNRLAPPRRLVPPAGGRGAAPSGCSTRASSAPRPGLDDKVLTEWNALMLAALAEAGALLGEPSWVDAAADAARSCSTSCAATTGRWCRSWQADGTPRARHDALAADHAALRRRVHPPRGGHRARRRWIDEAMDSRRHDARPLLGSRRGRPVHHGRRRRGAGRAPEGPVRQRHCPRPTRPPPSACSDSPR